MFTDPSGNFTFKVNQPTQQEELSGYISMFVSAAVGYFFPPVAEMAGSLVSGLISGFAGGFVGGSVSSWAYKGSFDEGLFAGFNNGMYGTFNGFQTGLSNGIQYYSSSVNMERQSAFGSNALIKERDYIPDNGAILLPEVEIVRGTGKIKGGVPYWWGLDFHQHVPSTAWFQTKVNQLIEWERINNLNDINNTKPPGQQTFDFNFPNFQYGRFYKEGYSVNINLSLDGKEYPATLIYRPAEKYDSNLVTDIQPGKTAGYYGTKKGLIGKQQLFINSHVWGNPKYTPGIIYINKTTYNVYLEYAHDSEY